MEEIIKTLENIGLEKKEVKIYLTLLKEPEITATKVSAETKIERTLCYSILQKLIDKGLVSYIFKNNVKYFQPINPTKILEDLEDKKRDLKQIMPKLQGLSRQGKSPSKAEIYQGKEGTKAILRDIVKEKKDYIVFGEEGRFQEILPIYSEQFMRKIELAKIKEKVLANEKNRKKIVKSKNSTFKYLPEELSSPSSMVVYANKTAIIVWSEPFLVFLIENKEVADSYRNYFEMLWKIAKS